MGNNRRSPAFSRAHNRSYSNYCCKEPTDPLSDETTMYKEKHSHSSLANTQYASSLLIALGFGRGLDEGMPNEETG